MTKQHINIGDSVNDKRGDPLRTAFDKVNQNFDELYNSVSAVVVAGATAPTTPGVGDLWYDTNSGRTYVYYDSTWVDASPVDGAGISSTNELVNGTKTVGLDANGVLTLPNSGEIFDYAGGAGTLGIFISRTFQTPDNTNVSNFGTNTLKLLLSDTEATEIGDYLSAGIGVRVWFTVGDSYPITSCVQVSAGIWTITATGMGNRFATFTVTNPLIFIYTGSTPNNYTNFAQYEPAGAGAAVVVFKGGNSWYFDKTGDLNLPPSGTIRDSGTGDSLLNPTKLINGAHELVLNVNGAGPWISFPESGGQQIQIQGTDINGIGTFDLSLMSTENGVVISANSTAQNGPRRDWNFGPEGKLTLPGGTTYEYVNAPLTGHGDGLARLDFTLVTDGVDTQWAAASASPAGSGYSPGDTFTFDAEFLGIPGASVTIEVLTVGAGGSIENLGFTSPPLYPADIYRDSPINLQVGPESNRWTFGATGTTTFPVGVSIKSNGLNYRNIVADTDLALTIIASGTSGSAAVNWSQSTQQAGIQFNNFGAGSKARATITASNNVNKIWVFDEDGALTFPDSTVQSTAWTGITGFGEGFSLTDADKIVTNKLYSTNLTQPTQHYRLELDTNGVVVLPDGSIINGSTIRGVAGTSELNYTGITIGPNSNDAEKTWVWVDHANAYITTNNAANTWTFGNDGSLTLPSGNSFISNLVVVGDLSTGSQIQVGSGVEADTGIIISNSVTNSLGEGGPALESGSLVNVNGSSAYMALKTVNSLGGDSTLTGEEMVEVSSSGVRIGVRVTNDLGDGSPPVIAFSGWTFDNEELALPLGTVISETASSPGLYRTKYSGTFVLDPTWFAANTGNIVNGDSFPEGVLQNYDEVSGAFSFQYFGYFVPPTSANYTFRAHADETFVFWIGAKALSDYTYANKDMYGNYNGTFPEQQTQSFTIALTAGEFYPIRIQWANSGGIGQLDVFTWANDVGQANTADFTGRVFRENTGTAKIAVNDNRSIILSTDNATDNNWTFAPNGSLTFPDGTTTTGKSITVPVNQSLTVNLPYDDGFETGTTTFKINTESIKLPTGNGYIYSGSEINANKWGLDSGNKELTFPNGDSIHYDQNGTGLQLYTYANPIKITSAQTKTWEFGTDGELALPTNGYTEAVIKELDATALVLFAQKAGANVKILAGATSAAGAKQWLFNGTNGNLTLPASGDVVDSTSVSQLAKRVEGSWTVTAGTNTYSFTVPADGTYTMWVKGNIPNGIITWNATLSITNNNVPAIGTQYAWNYTGGGSPILLTAIPDQIRGAAGTISTDATYVGTTSNRFDFGISNSSGSSQTIYYGWIKI